MNTFYRDYPAFLHDVFGPGKFQKITLNTAHSCPNRDGTIGRGGCVYCNNDSFSPAFAQGVMDVNQQIEKGKEFFGRKYRDMQYLAYFQAYTFTHRSTPDIMRLLGQAASGPRVRGIVIGTRPDCMAPDLLQELAMFSQRHMPVIVEYGAETAHNATLQAINRGHTWQQTVSAVERTAAAGLPTGLHFIMGLPGEDMPMMHHTLHAINTLPVSTVKFHQLQIVTGTPLAAQFEATLARHSGDAAAALRAMGIHEFTPDSYLDFCVEAVHTLRGDIAIERFVSSAPPGMVLHPHWGLKNYEFQHRLLKRLQAVKR